jgi:hypothetical protein
MSLENMRTLGVRSVDVTCACGNRASIDVSTLPGEIEVPALRQRLRCVACGRRPQDIRPDWSEHRAHGMGRQG